MKYYLFLLTLFWHTLPCFSTPQFPTNNLRNVSDSSLHQRFVANLLNEFNLLRGWIFVKIERCNGQSSYEIVQPIELYNALREGYDNLEKKQFVWIAFETINKHNSFFNCPSEGSIYNPKATYVIKGKKVNMNIYSKLEKKPIENILKLYFDKKMFLRAKHYKILNELIAVCYKSSIKVIIENRHKIRYEIFQ